MRSFPLVDDVGIVIVRDCTRERQTVPAEYTLTRLQVKDQNVQNRPLAKAGVQTPP